MNAEAEGTRRKAVAAAEMAPASGNTAAITAVALAIIYLADVLKTGQP